ncbi:MAG: hypothetical protein ACD_2C00189G0002 [uncultured bacterium (gcode 4)]|uniref:Uncharacterized protein n=1 Tax=uncultured bacterium (gcode 4) TaxID=1234023 RepID=K2G277_9BACT|nr:MAG: hypothetical protein ACD_2C00189G0002 [uncultured bacterium (gcode 4)]
MPFISFDHTLLTWEDFFDENNSWLVDSLNVLAEKFRNNSIELVKYLKEFEDCYKKTAKDWLCYMSGLEYSNDAYIEHLNKIQVNLIESNNLNIIWWKRKFTKEYLEHLREMVFNLIAWDRSRVKFLQQNIKLQVKSILS